MNRSGERLLTLLLLGLAAGLCYALYAAFNDNAFDAAETAASAPQAQRSPVGADTAAAVAELPPAPPLARFEEMTARPLFSQSRRPPAPGEEPVASAPQLASAPPDQSQYSVMGILITDNQRSALLKPRGKEADTVRASEGEMLPGSGWKITEITPEWVKIEQQGSSETLKLSDNVLSAADRRKLQQQAQKEQLQAVQQQQQEKLQALGRAATERTVNLERRQRTVAPPRRIISPNALRPTVRARDR
ncbi:MAG: hypothetical protein KDI68_13980 [Gammaproteobacteria bacterium]|nr:hypothetical protein [Gammaproteobacteria bacterium]